MNPDLSRLIHAEIIDSILNSSLNIVSISDDTEREIYERILAIVDQNLGNNWWGYMTYIKDMIYRLVFG